MSERGVVHASSHTESTATWRTRRTGNQLPRRIFASPASPPLAAPPAPLPPSFSPTRWVRSPLCVPLSIWACGDRLRTTRVPANPCSTLQDLDSLPATGGVASVTRTNHLQTSATVVHAHGQLQAGLRGFLTDRAGPAFVCPQETLAYLQGRQT